MTGADYANGRLLPVLRIDVERGLFVHKSPGGYFRRIGRSKREMPPDTLARLFQERSQSRVIRFDESIIPRTERADLDYALTQRFLRTDIAEDSLASETDSSEAENDTLRKLRVVGTATDDRLRLTLAGTLLCTREPQQWLPHAHTGQSAPEAGKSKRTHRVAAGSLRRAVWPRAHAPDGQARRRRPNHSSRVPEDVGTIAGVQPDRRQ